MKVRILYERPDPDYEWYLPQRRLLGVWRTYGTWRGDYYHEWCPKTRKGAREILSRWVGEEAAMAADVVVGKDVFHKLNEKHGYDWDKWADAAAKRGSRWE